MYQALVQIAAVYGLGCFFAGATFMMLVFQLYRAWQRRTGQECHEADTGKVIAIRGRRTDNLV